KQRMLLRVAIPISIRLKKTPLSSHNQAKGSARNGSEGVMYLGPVDDPASHTTNPELMIQKETKMTRQRIIRARCPADSIDHHPIGVSARIGDSQSKPRSPLNKSLTATRGFGQ